MRYRYALLGSTILVGVPAAAYLTGAVDYSTDRLALELRAEGFLPITPPSNLMNLGSLYYVDRGVHHFTEICAADDKEVQPYVHPSHGEETVLSEIASGSYSLGVDVPFKGGSSLANDSKYHYDIDLSLSKVELSEIPVEINEQILSELLGRKGCRDAVSKLVETGYVCQGQELLEATALYDFRAVTGDTLSDAGSVPAGGASVSDLKEAVELKTNVSLQKQAERWRAGTSLKYGVVMDPLCLSPPQARFARILPRNSFDAVANYIKFNWIERILPGTAFANDTKSADATR